MFFLGKLLSRSYRIAYALLHKVGSHKDGTSIMLEDRVRLKHFVFVLSPPTRVNPTLQFWPPRGFLPLNNNVTYGNFPHQFFVLLLLFFFFFENYFPMVIGPYFHIFIFKIVQWTFLFVFYSRWLWCTVQTTSLVSRARSSVVCSLEWSLFQSTRLSRKM